MVKINPGSKQKPDNDTRTHVASPPHDEHYPAIKTADGKYECPLCHQDFRNENDYFRHALDRHEVEAAAAAGELDQA